MYFIQPQNKLVHGEYALRLAFPQTSLPPEFTDDVLSDLGVYRVLASAPNHDHIAQGARELPPKLIDGKYVQQWEIYQLDAEAVDANRARQRAERTSAIASRRYDAEVAGVVWRGYGIATDRGSRDLIDQEVMAISRGERADGEGWKCLNTATGRMVFWSVSNDEFNRMASFVRRYVKACFAREAALLAALDSGDYSDSMLDTGWPSQQVG